MSDDGGLPQLPLGRCFFVRGMTMSRAAKSVLLRVLLMEVVAENVIVDMMGSRRFCLF